jgi:transaldolase
MKIFIDSADIDEIRQAYAWGIADGVTTNPSLMKKAVDARHRKAHRLDLQTYIAEICMVAKGTPVSLEVTETTAEGMIRQGLALYKLFNPIAKNVVIKIPINPAFKDADATHFDGSQKSKNFRNHEFRDFDGIKAIKALANKKIPVNCTLVFTPEQALLAAKAGAAYVSPFLGRVDDFIRTNNNVKFEKKDYFPAEGMTKANTPLTDNGIYSGVDLVYQMRIVFDNYNIKTKILAASLRNTLQVREAAKVGSNVATLPFSVIQNMLKHTKTYEGIVKFTKDIVPAYVQMTENGKHDASVQGTVSKKESTMKKSKDVVLKVAGSLKPRKPGWIEIKRVEK